MTQEGILFFTGVAVGIVFTLTLLLFVIEI